MMATPKKSSVNAEDTHTILGPESAFEGKLVFNGGQVRIDGNFKGEVKTDSTLIIGPEAHVEATVEVGTVVITGTVIGDIHAKQSVGIEGRGKVKGTITTPELMIQKGVIFEGTCKMEEASKGVSSGSITRLVSTEGKDSTKG